MKRVAAGLLSGLALFFALSSCRSSQPAQTDDDTPSPAAMSTVTRPATVEDPRVGEQQALIRELLDRIEVLDARVARLETAASAPATAAAAGTPVRTTTATAVTPSKPATASKPVEAVNPASDANTVTAYRNALELYGKGRLDDARRAFQSVFDSDPNGELADNALYWIGETYFVTGKYQEAMKYYRRIVDDYPDQNKAPDALLKTGLAYEKLGDLGMARKTFADLLSRYPYSTPAATAKQELKRIQY